MLTIRSLSDRQIADDTTRICFYDCTGKLFKKSSEIIKRRLIKLHENKGTLHEDGDYLYNSLICELNDWDGWLGKISESNIRQDFLGIILNNNTKLLFEKYHEATKVVYRQNQKKNDDCRCTSMVSPCSSEADYKQRLNEAFQGAIEAIDQMREQRKSKKEISDFVEKHWIVKRKNNKGGN